MSRKFLSGSWQCWSNPRAQVTVLWPVNVFTGGDSLGPGTLLQGFCHEKEIRKHRDELYLCTLTDLYMMNSNTAIDE
jgi:hypothetical protein